MNAGAEDMQQAEGEDGVLEGYKARRTPVSPVGVAHHPQNPSLAKEEGEEGVLEGCKARRTSV